MVSTVARWQARRCSRHSRGHEAGVSADERAGDYELAKVWCGSGFHTGQITDDDLLRFFSVFEALEDVGMSKPNVEPFHIHAINGGVGRSRTFLPRSRRSPFTSPGLVPFVGPRRSCPGFLLTGRLGLGGGPNQAVRHDPATLPTKRPVVSAHNRFGVDASKRPARRKQIRDARTNVKHKLRACTQVRARKADRDAIREWSR